MTDHPTFYGPQFAPTYMPEIRALAKLIKRNGGRIPRHEQERALELASRIDAQAENNPMLEVERTVENGPATGGTKMTNCPLDDELIPIFPVVSQGQVDDLAAEIEARR